MSEFEGAHVADGPAVDGIDRRAAIKKAAIVGATAGVVWSAPKVQGVTLRPNYAAAASAPTTPQTLVANIAGMGLVASGNLACASAPAYTINATNGGGLFPPLNIDFASIPAVADCLVITSMRVVVLAGVWEFDGVFVAGDTWRAVLTPGQPPIIYGQAGAVVTIEYECVA